MSSVLQQIAQQFESIDPDKAKELRRIDTVYSGFGLNNGVTTPAGDDPAYRLLRYLPRMARMKNFRLYRIGVGEQSSGGYAHQAVAVLETDHLPTPGNTLAVLDPVGVNAPPPATHEGSQQYFFEVWQTLQHHYGHGCALISDAQPAQATH